MAGRYNQKFKCGHEGCSEYAFYELSTRKEAIENREQNGGGKWKCIRHSDESEVLSLSNSKRVYASTSKGGSWGHSGLVIGPGFKAFCKDFPEGALLVVTAEVFLPGAERGEGG